MGNLVTGKIRFSYVNVFSPRVTPNGEEKYSVTILIPKNDIDTYQRISDEINKCLQENLASVFNGVMPSNPKLPIHDGDGLRQSGEPYGAECKGHWVITASSKNAPQIVDNSVPEPLPIMSKEEFYSGCYGRASLRFYAYNQNGNKGIGCGLGNVQKLEDGQPLDGRTTAAEDFAVPYQDKVQSTIKQPVQNGIPQQFVQTQYQMPVQNNQLGGQNGQINGQIDPITGQPIMHPTINNIYGVN